MLTGMMVYLMGTIVTYANNYPNTPLNLTLIIVNAIQQKGIKQIQVKCI